MSPTGKIQDYTSEYGVGAENAFENLNEQGTYLSNWSGHLIRVPADAIKPGRSPVIEILGREPMIVTKLSTDPFIGLTKARLIAADLDLPVAF